MNSVKEKDKISIKELYPSIVHLITHTDTLTWNRFNIFLVYNSVLILVWYSIFKSVIKTPYNITFLCVIEVFGIISGIVWAILARRGREFVRLHVDQAAKIENDTNCWPDELKKHKPLTEVKKLRDKSLSRYFGSYYLLQAYSYVFIIIYILLFVVSILNE